MYGDKYLCFWGKQLFVKLADKFYLLFNGGARKVVNLTISFFLSNGSGQGPLRLSLLPGRFCCCSELQIVNRVCWRTSSCVVFYFLFHSYNTEAVV